MWPARLRHPENARSQKQNFVHLLSSWGSPSYCFHRSFWSNALGSKPSDSYQRGDPAPFWEEKMEIRHPVQPDPPVITPSQLMTELVPWAAPSLWDHGAAISPFWMTSSTSLFPVSSPSSTWTPQEHLQVPLCWRLALSWVCNSSQFSNIWKFN